MSTNGPMDDSLEAALNRVLDERARLRKNGETWLGYVAHLATPQRIGWLLLAVGQVVTLAFTLGGRMHDAQTALIEATRTAVSATQKADEASKLADTTARRLEETRRQIEQTHTEFAGVVVDLQRQTAQQADLKERVALSVTRAEFSSALAQQILPRLERIEQRLWQVR